MNKPQKIPIVVILGQTATGKSDLAVLIAKKIGGEIISADSRQVYKGLNLGTGKITKKEMRGVRHHLLDIVNPKKRFSVIDFVRLADKAVEEICGRGKIPILCGGTGFYISSLIDRTVIPDVPPNKKLREELAKKAPDELLTILKKLDQRRSMEIDPNNSRRIIRAIEIAKALGSVPTTNRHSGTDQESKYTPIMIGLKASPEILRLRIDKRLLKRIDAGMIEEAKSLHDSGLSWKRMEELGLEYKYLALHLQGKMTREEMISKLKIEIWRYARRQMTWFKKDPRIHWLSVE